MDESVVKHLEQLQTGTLKLSAVVREHGYGDPSKAVDCVLGRSYQRLMGHPNNERHTKNPAFRDRYVDYATATAEVFNVPLHACHEAEMMCLHGKSHIAIADWLEDQGY